MLRIRSEQLAALERAPLRELEGALCRHARTYFPRARQLDDAVLRPVVAGAVARAMALGMRSERSLCRFVGLVLEYGAGFETDPSLAWMRKYLDDAGVADPEERVARLHTAVAVRRERGEDETEDGAEDAEDEAEDETEDETEDATEDETEDATEDETEDAEDEEEEDRLEDENTTAMNKTSASDLTAAAAAADQASLEDAAGVVQGCALAPSDWIEIVLLGEDGREVPDEAYAIVLPDGSKREGKVDARGRARVDGIPSGTCRVTFPRLDLEAWECTQG
jgi:hypothetical protein